MTTRRFGPGGAHEEVDGKVTWWKDMKVTFDGEDVGYAASFDYGMSDDTPGYSVITNPCVWSFDVKTSVTRIEYDRIMRAVYYVGAPRSKAKKDFKRASVINERYWKQRRDRHDACWVSL